MASLYFGWCACATSNRVNQMIPVSRRCVCPRGCSPGQGVGVSHRVGGLGMRLALPLAACLE